MNVKITSYFNVARCVLLRNGSSRLGKTLPTCTSCLQLCNFGTLSTNATIQHQGLTGVGLPWLQQSRNYAKKLSFSYSNDLTRRSKLNKDALVYNYKGLGETIQKAPDIVHKLSSLEYANGAELKHHRLEEMHDRIESLFGSRANLEQRVAKLTVEIRSLIPHCLKFRQDKYQKSQLVEKIQKRKKLLKFLRREDYEQFLWLLRELRIKYVPPPEYHGHLSRKYLHRARTKKAAWKLRAERLKELEERLEAERAQFEVHKEKMLAQMEEDIAKLSLDPKLLDSHRKPLPSQNKEEGSSSG